MTNQTLKNKNCLLTGATGGLGKELAIHFAESGCNLFLTSRSNEKLGKLQNELKSLFPNLQIHFGAFDISVHNEIEKLIKSVRSAFTSTDILVNCAGIFPVKLLQESTINDFDKCFNVNIRAPFILCKEFSQDMVNKKWGRIVNIASSGAYNGRKKTSIYRSTKHALLGFSRSIHSELKEHNVRTFCISPGPIKTPMGNEIIKYENQNENFESFMNPTEIAEFITHIISYDSEMISEEVRLSRIN